MTRIAFNRKNKILASLFGQKCITTVLEQNYRLHCNINNKPVPENFDMKILINDILKKINANERRARTMDIDDFVR